MSDFLRNKKRNRKYFFSFWIRQPDGAVWPLEVPALVRRHDAIYAVGILGGVAGRYVVLPNVRNILLCTVSVLLVHKDLSGIRRILSRFRDQMLSVSQIDVYFSQSFFSFS